MANAFAPKESSIPLKPKATIPEHEPVRTADKPFAGLSLPAPKQKRKQCSFYLTVGLIDQIRKVAKKHGSTISDVAETCIKAAIDQLEV